MFHIIHNFVNVSWGSRRVIVFAISLSLLWASGLTAETRRVPQDYETIQAAIDASADGDTVLVDTGIYREHIRLREGVMLRSVGDDSIGEFGLRRSEATIIDGGGTTEHGPGVLMASGSTLDGFTVQHVGVYDHDRWTKHHASQGDKQAHEHIGAPGVAGIDVDDVSCTIKNNIVHHIGYTGIAIRGQDCSPLVERNVCYRNMGGGIGSMNGSTALIQENVCFQNFYAGIGHEGAGPTVVNNVCYENIRAGIGISEGACPIVRNNKCYKNRRSGIGTRTGANTRPIIEDNECYENDMAGIGSDEHSAPVIRNNRCYRNRLAGIGTRNHAAPTIVGNECWENEKAGIAQESDAQTTLIDNYCHHNKASGIGFETCSSGRATVIGNRIIDNALVAVGIHAGWTVRLSDNELSRAGGMPPIVMVFDGADVTLTGNLIRGSGVAGIRAAGKVRADNNEIVGLSIRKTGPPNFGVWALPSSKVSVTGNKIDGWRQGVHAKEATVWVSNNRLRNFHRVAIEIDGALGPSNVFGNTAYSSNPDDAVIRISGPAEIVSHNRLVDSDAIESQSTSTQ